MGFAERGVLVALIGLSTTSACRGVLAIDDKVLVDGAAEDAGPDAGGPPRPCGERDCRGTLIATTGTVADMILGTDGFLYWTDADARTVNRVPKNGGEKVTLATTEPGLEGITKHGQRVYFATRTGTISRIDLLDSKVTVLTSSEPGAKSVWATPEFLYFTRAIDEGDVRRLELASGNTTVLVPNARQPDELRLVGTTIFFRVKGPEEGIHRSDGPSTPATRIFAGPVSAVAHDGQLVFFGDVAARALRRVAPLGGEPVVVAKDQGIVQLAFMQKATDVVWTSTDGAVRRTDKSGNAPVETLASGHEGAGVIVADDTTIYFAANAGIFMLSP